MASRRHGAGATGETAVPLNGGLLVAVVLGLPMSVLLASTIDVWFAALNDDADVVAEAVPYLRARLFVMAAVGMNFSFRGFWNGVDRSKVYLRTLVVMHVCNVAISWVLIFGHFGLPALGTLGAGIGTAASTVIGTGYYIAQGLTMARSNGFLRGLPDRDTLATMVRVSLPATVQQLLFAAGFTTMFWIIGQVGTVELAAASVLLNVTLVALLPGMGLGLAAAALVGQALGRGDTDDAMQWGWDVAKVAVGLVGLIALPMLIAPTPILGVFLHDPEPLIMARLPLMLIGATIGLDAIGMVLMNGHFGAGASRTVAVVSVAFQWGLFLPAAYVIGPVLGGSLLQIWIAFLTYRLAQTAVLTALWRRGAWASVQM
jgi:putative MATE family efflux protein